MGMYSSSASGRGMFCLVACGLLVMGVSAQVSAKELASTAIASAVNAGDFDDIRQAILVDMNQQQRFEIDESGIEGVGRSLLGEGRTDIAIEVLQLNQMIHGSSAAAANAIADAYVEADNTMAARMYYQRALELDSNNDHARVELARLGGDGGGGEVNGLSGLGVDPATLAAMGVTPEQMKELEGALAAAQQMGAAGATAEPPKAPRAETHSSGRAEAPLPEAAHESEFCEVLHRYNAAKRISDAQLRESVSGEYGGAADPDRRRTWNVETVCGDFLVAVPLWADVSPAILSHTGANRFEDSTGGIWEFRIGEGGVAMAVSMSSTDGTVTEMKRLGSPRSFD